jgi:hypothetical protein
MMSTHQPPRVKCLIKKLVDDNILKMDEVSYIIHGYNMYRVCMFASCIRWNNSKLSKGLALDE